MKKYILIIFALTTLAFDTQKEDAFDTGEYFKFRIHYGIVNAGYATLEVKDATINNKKYIILLEKVTQPECLNFSSK